MKHLMPAILFAAALPLSLNAQPTAKPPLHGSHWMAITGKPLGATAGAMIFQKGGNAVDAAAAMLAATATMWDVLSWGGETQALIYHPGEQRVIGINALGVAPTGATPEYYRSRGMDYPPEYGPLAAVTPGTPGGLMVMLAEYGKLSLAEVLAPAIEMADGYPIEAQTANSIENQKRRIKEWPYSRDVYLPHLGQEREAPRAGEIFRQPDLAATLRKLVEAERTALAAGKGRKEAILAAYDRFYRGDIAQELVRGTREQGGLISMEDLDRWQVRIEEPVRTSYRGIDVYKLTTWTQGPVLLQALNMLEDMDLRSMGYNSTRYIHALYQTMNLAFADRDFYYGDPAFPPEEPIRGLLSKEYAKARAATIDWTRNNADARPGDPYPYQGGTNPFLEYLEAWRTVKPRRTADDGQGGAGGAATLGGRGELGTLGGRGTSGERGSADSIAPRLQVELRDLWYGMTFEEGFYAGTTSIQAADAEGWVVSITPSGGWVPAVIAGRTGVGLSQRLQSVVLDAADNPYNVMAPGKRPRVTLTPSMALKEGRPFLSFAVQGGDSQDQNLLQFFLNVVEFDMTVQQAVEAANINSFQMRSSFGDHESEPGRLLVQEATPPWVIAQLRSMGYRVETSARTSGPINAIFFDRAHGTFWGGSSHHGEDYGIAW